MKSNKDEKKTKSATIDGEYKAVEDGKTEDK